MDDDDDEEDFCSTHTQTHRIAEHTDRLSQQLTNAPFSILICVFLLFTLLLFCSLLLRKMYTQILLSPADSSVAVALSKMTADETF